MMLEMKLTIHGTVQGVGYRYGVLEQLESEQIITRGYIRNLPNGTVELVAQGNLEILKDIRRIAANGVKFSTVREIEEVITPISEFTFDSFSVL